MNKNKQKEKNTPTLTEEEEKEFDEKFGENYVYWQEILAESRIGDIDFNSLKSFIAKVKSEAERKVVEEMREIAQTNADCYNGEIEKGNNFVLGFLKDYKEATDY